MYIWKESRASTLLLVALVYHSIVILGWQYCPPAIWLRALSRMALINAITPIPYSSPMLLIKSPQIYNTGRLLHGCDHKFVRLRRTGAIPHVKVWRRVVPAHFVQTLHISQERMIPIQSLHHQASSNAPTHTGRREDREISGKYVYSIAIGTNRSNWGAKVRPPRAEILGVSININESYMLFHNRLLFHLPIHLYDDFKE